MALLPRGSLLQIKMLLEFGRVRQRPASNAAVSWAWTEDAETVSEKAQPVSAAENETARASLPLDLRYLLRLHRTIHLR